MESNKHNFSPRLIYIQIQTDEHTLTHTHLDFACYTSKIINASLTPKNKT